MVTKREFDARRCEKRKPNAMSIDRALASDNPTGAIFHVLGFASSFSRSEQLFWDAAYFLFDTLNGGLHQTFTNSTGDLFEVVRCFVKDYCDVALFELFGRIAAVFPDGVVPADRDQRIDLIQQLSVGDVDPFAQLTDDFYRLEGQYDAGLRLLAERNREDFPAMLYER
jgi:hypothetical protein